MRNLYPLLLLLLTGMHSYSQNTSLSPRYTTPDSAQILDFRYGKVLTVKQNGATATYRLADIATGNAITVPFTGNTAPIPGNPYGYVFRGWVTPYGALIQAPSSYLGPYTTPLYEYNQGTVTQLTQVTNSVSTAGDYVLWTSTDSASHGLILRNMASHQQQLIADSVISGSAVAANGLVAYATRGDFSSAHLYRYQNGANTLIDQWELPYPNPDYPPQFYSISTDGEGIAYLRSPDEIGSRVYVYNHDSVSYVLTQGDYGGYADFPIASYGAPLINNGYVGGILLSAPYYYNVQGQVYTRDQQGVLRNVLPIQTGSAVGIANMLAISPQGDIAVAAKSGNNYATYIINQDGSAVKKVADESLRAYYEDSTWFVASDRTIYAVNLDTAARHYITPITKQVYTHNRVPITSADFLSHYIGPDSGMGRLEKIQFLSLPKKGLLVAANNQPVYPTNISFNRDMLDSLKYSAFSVPGKDTIRWRAFDGLKWTNDTSIYVTVLPAPDTITPFERTTLAGKPIRFWSVNFKQHFTGKLAGIRINRLPAYGKLTIGGKQIFYERSRDITLAEIDSMYYTPNPNIIGVDTLQWMAYNGTSYTPNDTPAILRVFPELNTPPILRTVESSYSQSGAADTILISNYPRAQAYTDVTAVVDNIQALPIAPDHSFVIVPSDLSVGAHQLKVLFKNRLDSISVLKSFTITSPFAPMMVGGELHRPLTAEQGVQVWPNPFSGQFTISGLDANNNYTLRLYDVQGRLALTERSFNLSRKVVLPGVNKGMYVLEVYDDKNKKVVKSIQLLKL
ncbi:T9SS type A sorting domain-containing protein [Chitinophaga agrisoli]|uniref:T9SS type A sorting domain-containing protein n=1 Tax=Chitinophaga agrisoli TaxID=2607653 RepID=A0A5B2VVR3_9BACT|nr:T9SS type A sorting domain-containing protein [Chitinophaga agrisoli]KAA2243371.1 T9SS type A sorting domain-containing protein [Chitinophaga agrisoli]